VAFGSQSAYAILSGNPVEQFGSSFTSELLWYRLFPSATYPLGVLTGALLLFFPILLYISLRLRAQRGDYHPLRVLGIAAILLVLFVGGLIVSVKIGGGSNLHNLDAFIVLFLVVSSYVYFDRIAKEVIPAVHSTPSDKPSWSLALILGIVILIPVLLTVDTKADSRLPEDKLVYNSIKTIQENINEAAEENGDVLFLSERQLLMFDTASGVPMVPEYEKVFLMEMAMANNPNYLDEFYENLRSHRYALIVSEPLKIITQDRTHSFGEENNAWVERVAKPLLCYYEPIETLKRVRTQLLIPRTEPTDCP
jgi:hypothetical protein